MEKKLKRGKLVNNLNCVLIKNKLPNQEASEKTVEVTS